MRRTDSFIGCLRSKVWQMVSFSRRGFDEGEPTCTGIPSRGSVPPRIGTHVTLTEATQTCPKLHRCEQHHNGKGPRETTIIAHKLSPRRHPGAQLCTLSRRRHLIASILGVTATVQPQAIIPTIQVVWYHKQRQQKTSPIARRRLDTLSSNLPAEIGTYAHHVMLALLIAWHASLSRHYSPPTLRLSPNP